jgi:hypothetical protein
MWRHALLFAGRGVKDFRHRDAPRYQAVQIDFLLARRPVPCIEPKHQRIFETFEFDAIHRIDQPARHDGEAAHGVAGQRPMQNAGDIRPPCRLVGYCVYHGTMPTGYTLAAAFCMVGFPTRYPPP